LRLSFLYGIVVPPCFHSLLFNATTTTAIYTLSLHDALPICIGQVFFNESGQPEAIYQHNADGSAATRMIAPD